MIRSGNREYVDVREQVMIYWQKKHKESASAYSYSANYIYCPLFGAEIHSSKTWVYFGVPMVFNSSFHRIELTFLA